MAADIANLRQRSVRDFNYKLARESRLKSVCVFFFSLLTGREILRVAYSAVCSLFVQPENRGCVTGEERNIREAASQVHSAGGERQPKRTVQEDQSR